MKTMPRPGDILKNKSGLTFRYLAFDGRFHHVRGTVSHTEWSLNEYQLRVLEPAGDERTAEQYETDLT